MRKELIFGVVMCLAIACGQKTDNNASDGKGSEAKRMAPKAPQQKTSTPDGSQDKQVEKPPAVAHEIVRYQGTGSLGDSGSFTLAFTVTDGSVAGELTVGQQILAVHGRQEEGMRLWVSGDSLSGYLLGTTKDGAVSGSVALSGNGGDEQHSGQWQATAVE